MASSATLFILFPLTLYKGVGMNGFDWVDSDDDHIDESKTRGDGGVKFGNELNGRIGGSRCVAPVKFRSKMRCSLNLG